MSFRSHDCIIFGKEEEPNTYTISLSIGGHAPVELYKSPDYDGFCYIYDYLCVCPTEVPLHALYFAYKK